MRMWRKGNSQSLLAGLYYNIDAASTEKVIKFSQKIKDSTAIWSSSFTSDYLPEETKTLIQNNIYIPVFITEFMITKIRSILNVHQQTNGLKNDICAMAY